jgi:hypothetical protein
LDNEGNETNNSVERKGVAEGELDEFSKNWLEAQKAGFYQPPGWFPELEAPAKAAAEEPPAIV